MLFDADRKLVRTATGVPPQRPQHQRPPATTQGIIDRCTKFCPQLRQAKILKAQVGLQPGRSQVRLEREDVPALQGGGSVAARVKVAPGGTDPSLIRVMHDVGHGGNGWTVHWGCAGEAAALVVEALAEHAAQQQQPAKL